MFAIVFFAFGAYLTFNVGRTRWSGVRKLRNEQAERLGTRNQLIDLISKANELIGRYEDLDKRSKVISAVIPPEPKYAEILSIVGSLADGNGMLLSKVSFQEMVQPKNVAAAARSSKASYATVKVALEAVGQYQNFRNWLKGIETELRLMDVDSISARTLSSKKTETSLKFDTSLLTYWQPAVEIASTTAKKK